MAPHHVFFFLHILTCVIMLTLDLVRLKLTHRVRNIKPTAGAIYEKKRENT